MQDVKALPAYLSKYEAMEIIGCDTNSLKLYLGQEGAFGVYPNQLRSEGWVSRTPTALALYQIDEVHLHGLWKVTGRQVANGNQIVTIELIENFPQLSEGFWCDLLAYSEDPDEDGYTGYTYPQTMDKQKTQCLLRMFWEAKHAPQKSPQAASRNTADTSPTEDASSLQPGIAGRAPLEAASSQAEVPVADSMGIYFSGHAQKSDNQDLHREISRV